MSSKFLTQRAKKIQVTYPYDDLLRGRLFVGLTAKIGVGYLRFMAIEEAAKVWFVINAKVRIDSANHNMLKKILSRSHESGFKNVAIDVRTTRFISIPAIQAISQFAELLSLSGGQLALIGPSERTKRHFEIYGSLKHLGILKGPEVVSAEKIELPSQESSSDQGPQL